MPEPEVRAEAIQWLGFASGDLAGRDEAVEAVKQAGLICDSVVADFQRLAGVSQDEIIRQ